MELRGKRNPTVPRGLLGLPHELRITILEALFPFWAEPHYLHLTSTGRPFHEPQLSSTDLAIMKCSTQMHYEAASVFYRHLVHFFHDYDRLARYVYRFNIYIPLNITLRLEPDCAAVYTRSTKLIEHLSECNVQKLRFDVSLMWQEDKEMTHGAFWDGVRLMRGLKEISVYACPNEMQRFSAIEELEQSLQCATLPVPEYEGVEFW